MLQMGPMNDLGLGFARKNPDAARSLFNLVGMNKPIYSGSQPDGQSYLDSLWNTRNPYQVQINTEPRIEEKAGGSVKPPPRMSDGFPTLHPYWAKINTEPRIEEKAGGSVGPPSAIREDKITKPIAASMSWLENVLASGEGGGAGVGAGLMTYAPVGSGENQRYISYPLMTQDKKTGQSFRFPDYHQALRGAMGSGEYISFQTAGEADWFSKNYRKMWGG